MRVLSTNKRKDIQIRNISKKDNNQIANIVRSNLKSYNLDIPGTAYFDPELENLSEYYENKGDRQYIVLTEEDKVIGGVGYCLFDKENMWAEMQKLYLKDEYKGKGYGRLLLQEIEKRAKEDGFKYMYLETHHNLKQAIQLYQKSNYKKIEKPKHVVHSTMDIFLVKEL